MHIAVLTNLGISIAVFTKEHCILSHIFQLRFCVFNHMLYSTNYFAYKSNHNKGHSGDWLILKRPILSKQKEKRTQNKIFIDHDAILHDTIWRLMALYEAL